MNELPVYEDRVVAFIDILGFSSHMKSLENDPELHRRLHYALTHMKLRRTMGLSGLEFSVFSDSIAVTSLPTHTDAVIWVAGWLQAQLLVVGILTRGGIAIGRTVHEQDVLYGQGMLNAYQLESSTAVYPRIILHPHVLKKVSPIVKLSQLAEDNDGVWFVDPFKFDAMAGGAGDLAADGYDPREVYFEEVARYIAKAKAELLEPNQLAKWSWLERRFSIAFQQYQKSRD